jgi:hypothetical protein
MYGTVYSVYQNSRPLPSRRLRRSGGCKTAAATLCRHLAFFTPRLRCALAWPPDRNLQDLEITHSGNRIAWSATIRRHRHCEPSVAISRRKALPFQANFRSHLDCFASPATKERSCPGSNSPGSWPDRCPFAPRTVVKRRRKRRFGNQRMRPNRGGARIAGARVVS